METTYISYILISIILGAVVFLTVISASEEGNKNPKQDKFISTKGDCPPYYLLTEQGDTINPISAMALTIYYLLKGQFAHMEIK